MALRVGSGGEAAAMADPSSRLGYSLWQAFLRVERLHESALQPMGLSLSSFGLLVHIGRQPGMSGADLSRLTPMTPQAVSKALARLEDAGLIERRLPARRTRAVELHLTDAGGSVLAEGVEALSGNEARLAEQVGVRRFARLIGDLGRVTDVLSADPALPAPGDDKTGATSPRERRPT